MIVNVVERVVEVILIGNGKTFAADCPQSTFRGETVTFHVGAALFLREPEIVPWVVIRDAHEEVNVDAVDRDHAQLDSPFREGADELFDGAGTLFRSQINRIALQQLLRAFPKFIMHSLWWRMLVVTFDVVAVMSRAKPARITR